MLSFNRAKRLIELWIELFHPFLMRSLNLTQISFFWYDLTFPSAVKRSIRGPSNDGAFAEIVIWSSFKEFPAFLIIWFIEVLIIPKSYADTNMSLIRYCRFVSYTFKRVPLLLDRSRAIRY